VRSSKSGLSSAARGAAIAAVVLIVLGAAYLLPSLTSGGTSSATQSGRSSSTRVAAPTQFVGLLHLFGNFSQMELQLSEMNTNAANPINQQDHVSYFVLGKGTINSTQYTKVAFSSVGVGNDVIAWVSPSGTFDRVDVLGQRNYTGNGAYYLMSSYINDFSIVPAVTNNATLFSMLSKTSQNSTTIGTTQVDVATYSLAVPNPPYKSITVMYATITGTSVKLAVYFHQKTDDGTDTLMQILSLKK